MSRKASTAALETFGQRLHRNQRRAPGHPAGERGSKRRARNGTRKEAMNISQARIAMNTEGAMNGKLNRGFGWRLILPAILRGTLGVMLGLLAFAASGMAQERIREDRVVKMFSVHRAEAENLQRWVNAGHETWCRNPELVAAATLKQVSPEADGYEFAAVSSPVESSHPSAIRAVYTFYSLDGRTSYRITLRRYPWLLSSAHSVKKMIWIPVESEKITGNSFE
jgi:hypothetical protein